MKARPRAVTWFLVAFGVYLAGSFALSFLLFPAESAVMLRPGVNLVAFALSFIIPAAVGAGVWAGKRLGWWSAAILLVVLGGLHALYGLTDALAGKRDAATNLSLVAIIVAAGWLLRRPDVRAWCGTARRARSA